MTADNRSASASEIVAFLDDLLDSRAFQDYGPNGLQVPGADVPAQTVATAVSATRDALEAAAALGADVLLVHHGLFWRGQPQEITPALHGRLKVLFGAEMALVAYHLPLDAHLEHGNNALLAAAVGLTDVTRMGELGVHGTLPGEGLAPDAFTAALRAAVDGRAPLHLPHGPERIRTVGIVTGAATDHMEDAIALGLDAYVTGEPAERAYGMSQDAGIHFYAAGHHATETFGVRALGALLAERFGLRHVYVDIPNPI